VDKEAMGNLKLVFQEWMAEILLEAMKEVLKKDGFEESVELEEAGGMEVSVWQKGDKRIGLAAREEGMMYKVEVDSQGLDLDALLAISAVEAAQTIMRRIASALTGARKDELERIAARLSEFTSSQRFY
jgi:hydrogenase maturation factor HypE